MQNLTPQNITVFFLSLGILLAMARIFGELAQKFHQPSVLGELFAGILLGPTVFGTLAPRVSAFIFPTNGPNAVALGAITNLAAMLFMVVAGMEVDLSTIWKQGKTAVSVSISGILFPFLLGLAASLVAPHALGRQAGADSLVFTLFFATALSISALPVIAKTLMDMGLYRSDLGMIVLGAAIFNDLIGWIAFAIILGLAGGSEGGSRSVGFTIALTVIFAGVMLTLGRWLIHRMFPFLQAYTKWPAGVLGFALTLSLLGAAFTEWIGIHAILGGFLVGVAVGDSSHLRERTRVTIDHFISFIFAPVFFAGIGLQINLLAHFSLRLVVTVFLIACLGKLAGGVIGAWWGGMPRREAVAAAFAMNSRGAIEIILGLLALQAGIIREPLFEALMIMAMITSLISGPALKIILRPEKKRQLRDVFSARLFLPRLKALTRREAIREMANAAGESAGLDPVVVETAVWKREEALSTGVGNSVALPNARVKGLSEPLIVVGVSEPGIDFDAPDDKPAQLIFLVLTSEDDPRARLDIRCELAGLFRDELTVQRALRSESFTDFLALLKAPIEAYPLQKCDLNV